MNIVHSVLLLLLLGVLGAQCLQGSLIYDENNRLNVSASCPNATCSLWQLESDFEHPLLYSGNKMLQLQELLLANCQIRWLPLELLRRTPNLRVLQLQNSTIHSLNINDFQTITQLKQFTLQRSHVSHLKEQQFDQLQQLEILQLGHNIIQMVGRLAFVGLSQLKLLGLQGNGLSELSDGAFDSLSNLVHIDLSDNAISGINNKTFAKNNKLQTLLLNGNKFEHFESNSLSGLTNLRLLDLSNCQLEELQLHGAHKLLIEGSGLRRLIIDAGVINLKAGNNALTQLQIADKSDVIELDLHENQFDGNAIATLLDGMWNLQRLDLSKNKIDSLWLSGSTGSYRSLSLLLPSLTHLNLAHNQLQILPPDSSLFPSRLIKLDLSYNHLLTVTIDNFATLPNLQRLYLEEVRLTRLDYKLLHSQHPNLQELGACDPDWSFMHKLTIYLTDRGVFLPVSCSVHRPETRVLPHLQSETGAQSQSMAGVGSIHPYWTTRDILAFITLLVVFIILLMQLYRILEEEGWLRRMQLWLRGRQPPVSTANGSRTRRLNEQDSESSSA